MDAAASRPPVWNSVYFLALLLVITPFADLLGQVGQMQMGELVWRYGFLGFVANNLLTPLLGFTLAAVAAGTLRHRRVLKTVGILCVLMGVVLFAFAGIFSLDVIQIRTGVEPVAQRAFRIGALIALAKYLAAIVGLGLVAWTSRRTIRGWAELGRQRPLEVGASPVVARRIGG